MVQDNSEVKLGLNWTLIMDSDDEVEFVVHKSMTLTTEMSDWLAQKPGDFSKSWQKPPRLFSYRGQRLLHTTPHTT
jgi:hypothetical protein